MPKIWHVAYHASDSSRPLTEYVGKKLTSITKLSPILKLILEKNNFKDSVEVVTVLFLFGSFN